MRLSEEQRALRDTTTEFAAEHLAPHAVEWDQTKHFPVEVLRKAAQLGLGGLYLPEKFGGAALGRWDGTLVFEALAGGCPSIAAYVSIHNMVATMIDQFGDEAQRHRYLPGMSTMDSPGSYCLTEPDAGSDAGALSTRARREGEHYVLDGFKQFISGAGHSEVYVVFARTGGPGPHGISAFILDRDTPGLSFGPNEHKMGWNAQPTRQVILDSARVPAAALLGTENGGFGIAMSALDGGRLNIGACSLGGAEAALGMAVRHLSERSAFGARLSQAQALQFRLADMRTDLEAARSLLWRAATALDQDAEEATHLSAMAKRICTDTGFEVANQALQLHGGYGYLAEYGLEKIVRDLRVHQILEGTNEIMRVIISRRMLAEAA
ncbi:acyl-CoA dehydrogenase family protein [Sciscionella marina]|uniref:acyl-CoA dehydrogenase family protein n=1 Tax=Sciscionella marina TaxID=508770 RepID=UPI0003691EA8|nr:acyl-CoA dehydrogenase family protein [Sciscionella marina]